MLQWIIIGVATIAGLVGLAAVIGLMLPKGHRASTTASFSSPAESIHAAILDVARYPEWRSDLKRVELLPDDGQGLRFKEIGRHGPITMRFEVVEPARIVGRIADPSLPFGGTWTYELNSSGAGTVLTITEDGEVYNPIFRLVSKMMSQTATMEAYLAGLRRRVP